MAIATVSEFVLRGIIQPIMDMFVVMYGLTEPIISQLTSEHPNWIYSHIAVLAWVIKVLSATIGETANNSTLVAAFNDSLHTLSVKSNTFFGNLTGKSGMSYIAKHAYLELLNNRTLSMDLSAKFMRALNSTITFIMKGFELL